MQWPSVKRSCDWAAVLSLPAALCLRGLGYSDSLSLGATKAGSGFSRNAARLGMFCHIALCLNTLYCRQIHFFVASACHAATEPTKAPKVAANVLRWVLKACACMCRCGPAMWGRGSPGIFLSCPPIGQKESRLEIQLWGRIRRPMVSRCTCRLSIDAVLEHANAAASLPSLLPPQWAISCFASL